MEFKDRLISLRGYTPRSVVCLALGVKEATYASWEYGRTEPGISNLAKIARHYGCSGDYLLGLSESVSVSVSGTGINSNTGHNSPGAAAINPSCAECALARTIERQAAIIERLTAGGPPPQAPAPAKKPRAAKPR